MRRVTSRVFRFAAAAGVKKHNFPGIGRSSQHTGFVARQRSRTNAFHYGIGNWLASVDNTGTPVAHCSFKRDPKDMSLDDVRVAYANFCAMLIGKEKSDLFDNTVLVSMQHLLSTVPGMFEALKEHGLTHTFLADKAYSTHRPSVERVKKTVTQFVEFNTKNIGYFGAYRVALNRTTNTMWDDFLNYVKDEKLENYNLLTMDEGGEVILTFPYCLTNGFPNKPVNIMHSEQTNGGAQKFHLGDRVSNLTLTRRQSIPHPIINVAGSMSKWQMELPYVAAACVARIMQTIEKKGITKDQKIGLIGAKGYLARHLAHELQLKEFQILGYDQQASGEYPKSVKPKSSVSIVVQNADVIISATGTDITAPDNVMQAILESSVPYQRFINVASGDTEFHRLLSLVGNDYIRQGRELKPFSDLIWENDGKIIELLNGTFPLNFNGASFGDDQFEGDEDSVRKYNILPTRISMLAAQFNSALLMREGKVSDHFGKVLMLHPYAQYLVFQTCMEYGQLKDWKSETELASVLPTDSSPEVVEKIKQNSVGSDQHGSIPEWDEKLRQLEDKKYYFPGHVTVSDKSCSLLVTKKQASHNGVSENDESSSRMRTPNLFAQR